MREPPRVLVVDDNPANLEILETRLARQGYEVITARDGEEALIAAGAQTPDLILLDVMMPGKDGIQVCRELKADPSLPFMPVILVTAKADPDDIVAGLDAGGDEYITKPVDHAALVARVRSILRIKALHDTVQEQAGQLEDWTRTLEQRVAAQLAEIERLGSLKRFLSPQIAELVVASSDQRLLESHRREITVVFLDLRGFTAFAEAVEPEEVMRALREFHAAMGARVLEFQGTLERFTGDGLMVFFNDPLPIQEPARRAAAMAFAMKSDAQRLSEAWARRGYALGLGVGIAQGYATVGAIGFEGRIDYGAIGSVTNLASRLCDLASPGEILVSQRVHADIEASVTAQDLGDVSLHGFNRPVRAFKLVEPRRK